MRTPSNITSVKLQRKINYKLQSLKFSFVCSQCYPCSYIVEVTLSLQHEFVISYNTIFMALIEVDTISCVL